MSESSDRPPAYAEYIGHQLRAHLLTRKEAAA